MQCEYARGKNIDKQFPISLLKFCFRFELLLQQVMYTNEQNTKNTSNVTRFTNYNEVEKNVFKVFQNGVTLHRSELATKNEISHKLFAQTAINFNRCYSCPTAEHQMNNITLQNSCKA